MLQLLLNRWNPIACVKRQLEVVDVSEFTAPNQVQSLDWSVKGRGSRRGRGSGRVGDYCGCIGHTNFFL